MSRRDVVPTAWRLPLVGLACVALIAACRGTGDFFDGVLDAGVGAAGAGGGSFDAGRDSGRLGIDAALPVDAQTPDAGEDDPIWRSPFPNTGSPGWRNSTQTLCADVDVDDNAIDIWSDARGVFALVTGHVDGELGADLDAGGATCAYGVCNVEQLFHHDGTSWQLQRTFSIADPMGMAVDREVELRGAPLGALFIARFAGDVRDTCAVDLVEGATSRCILEQDRARALFVVNNNRAFVTEGDFGNLLRFDGPEWTQLSGASEPHVWADAEQVLVLSPGAPFRAHRYRDRDVPAAPVLDLGGPTSDEGHAIWARSTDDIWVGGDAGRIFHFDGQAWQQVATLVGADCASADGGVRGIWGSGDDLYVYSARSVMRWNGSTFESLASWSCDPTFDNVAIRDLWGNGDGDVFIALHDRRITTGSCGGAVVMHFDGAQFHRM